VEAVRPLGVPVADEDAMAGQKSIDRISQSTRRLRHEPRIRGGCRARHVNASASEIEHEERVVGDQPSRRPDLRGEEIGARDLPPVGLQERPPGCGPFTGSSVNQLVATKCRAISTRMLKLRENFT
jgi:hypothetical protein